MPCKNHPAVATGLGTCARCRDQFCPNCLVYIQGTPHCAACKSEVVKDVRAGVVTQGLDLASIGRRFGAQFVDGILLNIVSRVVMTATAGATSGSDTAALGALGMAFLVVCAVAVAYEALMLQSRGQTLGKMALKVKVVNADGGDITAGQAWTRAIVRTLLSLLVIVDYLPAFFTKDKTCLHDMAAKTRVVRWG